jgi:branched-chain amino acid transport system substrate-binding protein
MKKYDPDGNLGDSFNVYGYSLAQTLVQLLRQCGDGLTRENITQQGRSPQRDLPLLLPGIHVHTTPTDFFPLEQMRLQRFEGRQWICSEM